MRKVLIGFMIVCLGVTLNISMNQVKAKDLEVINEKMYDMFDKLYERDRLEQQDVLVIDTINDGNESVELDGIKYDKKVFYSSLFVENKNGKVKEKIQKYKETNKEKNHDGLDELNFMLDLYNSDQLNFNEIIDHIDENDMIKEYKKFYEDLIPKDKIKDDRLIELQTSYSYETVSIIYYEDYDSNKTTAGHFEKQLEYYGTGSNKTYTGIIRYVMAYPLNPYTEYNHQSTVNFTYDSYDVSIFEGAPEVYITHVIDYMGYQKIIVENTDDGYNLGDFKISQEVHYDRSQYNVELHNGIEYPISNYNKTALLNLNYQSSSYNYFHELLVTDGYDRTKYKLETTYHDLQTESTVHGSKETIIIENGNVFLGHDTSSLRMGTFNFGVSSSDDNDGAAHRIRDVYPYLVWGNNEEDYRSYSSYERFVWDKADQDNNSTAQNSSGSTLISLYENGTIGDSGGTIIPYEFVVCYNGNMSLCKLDITPPVITVYNKTINKGAYSNIDWTTRATILDDFTEEDKIISNEVYDNVVYDSVGNYYVKLEAYDLSGNRKEYQFIVTVQQIPGC